MMKFGRYLLMACYLLSVSQLWAEETLEERRQRIRAMKPQEQAELARQWQRYQRLSDAEKQRLAKLQVAVDAAADRRSLEDVMRRYTHWIGQQEPHVRLDLADRDAKGRVDLISRMVRGANDADRQKLVAWFEGAIVRNEARIVENLSDDQRRRLAAMAPDQRHRAILLGVLIERRRAPSVVLVEPNWQSRLASTIAELSPEAQRWLKDKPPREQVQQLVAWGQEGLKQQLRRTERGAFNDEALLKFFEESITPAERERLMGLSGEDLQRELRRLHSMRSPSATSRPGSGGEPDRRPRGGPGPGGRRFGNRPPPSPPGDHPPGDRPPDGSPPPPPPPPP